ncbi:MAG: J domain-containing protein [Nitrospirae bacterium]|nr:J domain-containing protein [Candidatus Manganitrophaceae bacterium]
MTKVESKKPTRKKKTTASKVKTQALLVINQAPIKKKALSEFKQSRKALLKIRAQLDHHLNVVRPSYLRWVTHIAGNKMQRMNELKRLIKEKAGLLQRIEELIYEEYLSPRSAYEYAEEEQARARAREEGRKDEEEPFSTEQEQEEAFEERGAFDGRDAGWGPGSNGEEGPGSAPEIDSDSDRPEVEKKVNRTHQIVSLYRKMARLLHPDTAVQLNEAARELWREVVEAYQHKDLARLEKLWISVQLLSDPKGEGIALSDLKQLTAHLNNEIEDLKDKMRELARTDPSWRFEGKDRGELASGILSDLVVGERELLLILGKIEMKLGQYQTWGRSRTRNRQPSYSK